MAHICASGDNNPILFHTVLCYTTIIKKQSVYANFDIHAVFLYAKFEYVFNIFNVKVNITSYCSCI